MIFFFAKSASWFVMLFYNVNARKYDLDAEANRMYKENFTVVLYKFRRSPEYTEILVHNFQPFFDNFQDMFNSYSIFYEWELVKEVRKKLNEQQPPKSGRFGKKTGNYEKFQNVFRSTAKKSDEGWTFGVPPKKQLNGTGWAQMVDRYPVFHSVLSADRRNEFRDLAFKYSGLMLDSLHKALGGADDGIKSTMAAPPVDEQEDEPPPSLPAPGEDPPASPPLEKTVRELLEMIPDSNPANRARKIKQRRLASAVNNARLIPNTERSTTSAATSTTNGKLVSRKRRKMIRTVTYMQAATETTARSPPVGVAVAKRTNNQLGIGFRAEQPNSLLL